jgi:hypothetical protein
MLWTWVIPDLDLADLSLWLADFKAAPVVFGTLSAAIGSILEGELVLNVVGYFINSDQPVVVVELVNSREVPVLLYFDWQVRLAFFDRESGAISL